MVAMKVRHFPYVAIYFLFIVENCRAQTQQVIFNLVAGANGIALGKINSITQDRQGVMWFSDQDHQCIIRYDGTLMTRYPSDLKNPNSLGGRYPECIAADSIGNIWIGFTGTGLDRFDPETKTFSHFRHQANDKGSLADDIVSAILVDHLGNLWVGSNGGLDLLDPATGRFKHFSHNPTDSTSLSYNIVRAIYEDHQGTIWVGTGFPWIEPVDRGGLNRFNRETGTFQRYLSDPRNPHSLINNKVRAIFEDSRGLFWVGTGGDGLHTMDRKTGVFERHPYNPARPEQLSRPPAGGAGDHITFITEDALGGLWIGTESNGLNRYDTLAKRVTHFGKNADGSGSFRDNTAWWAYASKDGQLWVSTQEPNLYRIDLFTSSIPHSEINAGVVHAFYEETPSLFWLGTDSGLIHKNISNGAFRRYKNIPLDPKSLSNNVVASIVRDEQGELWLGTAGGGVNRFNPGTGVFTRIQHDPEQRESLCNDNVGLLYEDRESNLWVATMDGLDLLDRKTGKFTHYRNDQNDTNSLSSSIITSIFEEEPDILWVGTYYAGVNRMDLRTGRCKHYLPSSFVTSIYKDAKGVIWVGAANGLYRYDKASAGLYDKGSAGFSFFGEGNTGFKINSALSIIGDEQDNLWIAALAGIYRINPARDQVIIYDKKNKVDGFSIQNTSGVSAYKARNGEIFFGSSTGYYAFSPDKLKVMSNAPKVDLTNFWLKGVAVPAIAEGPLTAPLSTVAAIHLRHDQNAFSLGFTSLDYDNPGDKTFYYKLENYDGDWRPAGAEERAYYFNVPPGKYVFRVKASNSINGLSAEKGIAVIISAPWWKTGWAYCTFFLLLVTGILIYNRVQRRRVIHKERERGKLRELEMQALRAQMNPHFIFNCLSSINNFITKNETEAASDYLTKFSRLIRTVLNNSKQSYIALEDEMQMLGLYLEMEKLRFKDNFTYGIHIDPDVDATAVFIPPLLFQPFVENAVWHGLMHKAEPGRLNIFLTIEKKFLVCIIEDNGVGRSFARAADSKSVEKKKSMGIQITRQRLALVNGNAGPAENDFIIEDLFDDVGHPAGTKVLLRIKYKEINDKIVNT